MTRHLGRRALLLVVLLVGTACTRASSVARMADGVVHEGRFIAPEAYAAYARGAWLEHRGNLAGALAEYESALDADPDAPEVLARIASASCRLAKAPHDRHAKRAERALEDAIDSDATSSVAFAAKARCHGRFGRHAEALQAALAAARADPESIPLQLLVVDTAEAAGNTELARDWLDAITTRTPESRLAWLRMRLFAKRHADAGRALRAAHALAGSGTPADPTDLEHALDSADLPAARAHAVALRIPPGELAARAALRGAFQLAREQAELVLAADPTDTDAWLALVAAQGLAAAPPGEQNVLERAPLTPAGPPSPSARRLHAELLERVVGPEARRAWEAAF